MYLILNLFTRNVLAAASPYFHAMFTSGLIESDTERTYRGADGGAAVTRGKLKHRQRVVLQGIQQPTLEVTNSKLNRVFVWSRVCLHTNNQYIVGRYDIKKETGLIEIHVIWYKTLFFF